MSSLLPLVGVYCIATHSRNVLYGREQEGTEKKKGMEACSPRGRVPASCGRGQEDVAGTGLRKRDETEKRRR